MTRGGNDKEMTDEELMGVMSRKLFGGKDQQSVTVEVRNTRKRAVVEVVPEYIPIERGGDHDWIYTFFGISAAGRYRLKRVVGDEAARWAIREYEKEGREVRLQTVQCGDSRSL